MLTALFEKKKKGVRERRVKTPIWKIARGGKKGQVYVTLHAKRFAHIASSMNPETPVSCMSPSVLW